MALGTDRRGAAVVEFALTAPLFLALLSAIASYGGWFWIAHEVQQAANEAARATLAGLTAAERVQLARGAVARQLDRGGALRAERAEVVLDETAEMVTVRVTYDATGNPFSALPLTPQPAARIRRAASVRLEQP